MNAIIVDDEEFSRQNLKTLVSNYCSHIKIVGLAESVQQARELIWEFNPEVVFLDIHMPGENGFDLLMSYKKSQNFPLIVFVTAHNNYAINAVKAGAFDYILKPIDIDELIECERRMLFVAGQEKALPDSHHIQSDQETISIRHMKGIKMIPIKDITYLEADNSYTVIHFFGDTGIEKFVVSRTLGDFEDILITKKFFRIHKSYLVNVRQVKDLLQEDNAYVITKDGSTIEISRRKKSLFRQYLQENYDKFDA